MGYRVVMLGDIVGRPGREAVARCVPTIRAELKPDLVLANAENAASGSGITPDHYRKLCAAGLDGLTLGDHVYKRVQIVPVLETAANIIRPANLPSGAKGRRWMKLQPPEASKPPLYVLTVLGRIFTGLPCNDPFATVRDILAELPEKNPLVLVEIHAEATSEKQALGRYFDGQVAAVIGSHTHVPTADARVLPGGTAYITDLGMCGPHESILGRKIDAVLKFMTTSMPEPFDVAEGDARVTGVVIDFDENSRRATAIQLIERPG